MFQQMSACHTHTHTHTQLQHTHCVDTEPRWPLSSLGDVWGRHSAWFYFSSDCILRTNSFYRLCFFLSTRVKPISPDHISRSQCNSLCHVTLSHTYTVDVKAAPPHRAPHTYSSKTGQKPELRPHTTHQSRERRDTQQYPNMQHTTKKKPRLSMHSHDPSDVAH